MSGYEHRSLTTIRRIQNDLRDRYQSGFPIIKEIIQNADDGNSERLDFGWTKGLLNAQHPLLKGPSLFFINNGQFKRSDAEAIRRFGDSEKEGEQTAIGKFGLGQKSIFHLCEAFFYLAYSPNEKFESRFPPCNFLNPWAEANPQPNELADPIHPDWEEFSDADQKCVKDHCQDILGQENYKQHFFILWIPLRKESRQKIKNLDGQEEEIGVIMNTFPGDQETPPNEIFPANLASEIGILLPLLRSLETVSYWLPNHNAKLQAKFQITLQGSRRHYTPQNAEEKPHEMSGCVQITHFDHEDKNSLVFSGYEAILKSRTLTNIRKHKLWPTSPIINSKTGIREPDKAFAHSAVTVIQKPTNQQSYLSLQWTVFLPLGEPDEFPNEKILYDGDKDYIVLLHGYFFVDAGRRHIEGKQSKDQLKDDATENKVHLTDDSTEAEIRQKWNQQLTTEGTLKNVLPALNRFVEKHQPNPEEIWSLSDALKKSKFFQKYAKDICQEYQWVYVVDKQEWQLIDTQQPLLAIPQPDKDKTKTLPWKVLPNLPVIQNHLITFIDAPNLTPFDLTTLLSNWSEKRLETVLQKVPGRFIFQKEEQLAYLLDFINQCVLHSTSTLSEILKTQLCHIAKQAFAHIEANVLYKFKERVTEFLNFIPEKCFFIECETYHAKLFFELNKLKTQTLLIPKYQNKKNKTKDNYFDFSEVETQPKLREVEAEIILKKLEILIKDEKSQKIVKDYADIAREIFQFIADKRSFVEKHPNLRVLRTHNCRVSLKGTTIVSFNEISHASGQGTLFCHQIFSKNEENKEENQKEENQKRKFANPLQDVLADATVIIIEARIAKLLGDLLDGQKEILHCKPAGCLKALSNRPVLNSSIDGRVELLNKLSGVNLDDLADKSIFTKGIRYLLAPKLELEDKLPLWDLTSSEHKHFVEPILEKCGKQDYLIDDAFVPSVVDELGPTKQKLIGIEELTPTMVIIEALNYAKSHELWQPILDALQDVDIDSFSEKQKLRQTAWLLDKTGEPIKPEEVVYLPEIKDTVSRLIGEQVERTYRDYQEIDKKIREHPNFKKLRDAQDILARSSSEGLDILGFIMNENEKYRLGDFTDETFPFRKCLTVFKDITPELLPAWAVIQIANRQYNEEVVQSLLSELFHHMPTERLVNLLLWLKKQHIDFPTKRTILLEVFNHYLEMAIANYDHFNETILRQILLLSRAGNWKFPSQLSLEAQNIDDDNVLDHTQAKLLRDDLNDHDEIEKTSVREDNKNIIDFEGYFSKWRDKISHEQIGIFLALLGNKVLSSDRILPGDKVLSEDDINVSELAQNYLGEHHRVKDVRKKLITDYHDPFWLKVNATQHGSGKTELTALDGSRFEANLSETVKSIFIIAHKPQKFDKANKTLAVKIGDVTRQIDISHGEKLLTIELLDIDTERQYGSDNLSKLLKEACASLLQHVYNQSDTNALEQWWEKFSQPEQLDIETARRWILNSAFFYLSQLNYRKTGGTHFRQLLRQWEQLNLHPDESGDKDSQENKNFQQENLLNNFNDLIRNKPEERVSILEAIKTTISSNHHYNHQSIPFELFQNADDSVVELEEMSRGLLPQSQRFVLSWDNTTLTLMHWGRSINQFRYGNFSDSKGRERGFDRDLGKMLVINSGSDKREGTTGQFGLGFKSVFLICQQPIILSGHPTIVSKQLGFQIIAGMLPVPLSDEKRTKLLATLKEQTPNNSPVGTIIKLAIDKGYHPKDIVDSFKQVVGILLAFSKRIKHCELLDSHNHTHSIVSWEPKPILDGISVGKLKLEVKSDEASTVLLIQNPEKQGILMRLGSQGVEPLPKHIPNIWVTTPLKESESMGFHFALNGRFEVSTGRTRLADSDKNRETIEDISHFVGQKLCDLFKNSQAPDFNFKQLGFATEISDYDFWHSIWKILGENWLKNSQVITAKLGHITFLQQLLDKHSAFPTELWGAYRVLTKVNKIEYVAVECLQTEDCFKQVAMWEMFKTRIVPGTMTSEKQWHILKQLLPESSKRFNDEGFEIPRPFDLADAVEREFGVSKKVSPELAQQLGQLINRECLNELKYKQKEQHQKLLDVLKQARFKAKDDQYHSVKQLLCEIEQTSDDEESANDLLGEIEPTSDNKNEECYRAAFAPNENVLAPEYSGQAVKFFKVCRQQMKMLDLIQWALYPDNDDQKKAILFYLFNGKKGDEIAKAFKKKTSGWWTNLEPTDELFDRLEKEEKIAVLFKLKQSELFAQFRKKYEENREQEEQERERKAINKKVGENVEKIIEKILRDKGLNVENIHKGGDLHIWPKEDVDVGWDISRMDIDTRRNFVVTMEIKFTTGSRAHLSSLQSETARKKELEYIVLVVSGDSELKEQLIDIDENAISDKLEKAIINNSHVVKDLHDKLGQLPNPDDITPDIQGYWLNKPLWGKNKNIVQWVENNFEK